MASGFEHIRDVVLPFLIGAVAFLLIFRLLVGRAVRSCDWRRVPDGDSGTLGKYRCATCGFEAFTATGKPPVGCRKGLKPKPL